MDAAQCEAQLEQLRGLLKADPSNAELKGLVADVEELLAVIHDTSQPFENKVDGVDAPANTADSVGFEFSTGDKCLFPFQLDSATYFLPAMVLTWSPETAVVLPIAPMTAASRPCENVSCRSSCDRSHGVQVEAGHLLPTELLESAPVSSGAKVLAEYDGLYSRASVITATTNGFWVEFHGYEGETLMVEHDKILPMLQLCPDGPPAELDELEDVENSAESEESDSWGAKGHSITFHYGDDQPYTKGIGAKLLAKMGYRPGEGLGLRSDGRRLPVEAIVLRPGRGLGCEDAVVTHEAEKRQKRFSKSLDSRSFRKKRKEAQNSDAGPKPDVFSFLNTTLNSSKARQPPPPVAKPSGPSSDPKPVNHHLTILQLQSRSAALAKDLARARESLARNAKNKKIAQGYRERIDEIQREFAAVQRTEEKLTGAVDGEKRKKNMMKF